jgi:hypothetical protein
MHWGERVWSQAPWEGRRVSVSVSTSHFAGSPVHRSEHDFQVNYCILPYPTIALNLLLRAILGNIK